MAQQFLSVCKLKQKRGGKDQYNKLIHGNYTKLITYETNMKVKCGKRKKQECAFYFDTQVS